MLEIKFVRENLELVKKKTLDRNLSLEWELFSKNDLLLRSFTHKIEELRHKKNVMVSKITEMKKNSLVVDFLVVEMRKLNLDIKNYEKKREIVRDQLMEIMMLIPNISHDSVSIGDNERDNKVLNKVGSMPVFSYKPRPHWEIGAELELFDFVRASKISGARFPLFTGIGARMERALINFMIDFHVVEHGYYEIIPPHIVKREALIGTGQLPKFENDLFKIEGKDTFLIPTAEVPLINMHRNEILCESKLPMSYVGYSSCFRSEAGSYGKDVRGLIRQHQFDKIELVKFSLPENSYEELEILKSHVEKILKCLDIHYRVVDVCTGDLGFSSSKTYDIEVWMPSQNKYREISSCSNCEDFQSRRANIRFKYKGKKGSHLVHTLNASGLAVGRTMSAIIENYQQPDGSLSIPKILQPYMGGLARIVK